MLSRRLLCGLFSDSAWTPADITTALWLDAADSSTITLNGSTVSQWADKSGNGRHVAQVNAACQPTRITYGLAFDGSDDVLKCSSFAVPNIASVFIVAANQRQPLVTNGVDCVASNSQLVVGNKGFSFHTSNWWASTTQRQFTWELVTGTQKYYKNGLVSDVQSTKYIAYQELFLSTGHSNISDSLSDCRLNIGMLHNVNNFYYYGKNNIYEIVVLASAENLTSTQLIEGYLAHKWDALLGVTTLVSALPSNHPYKTVAP